MQKEKWINEALESTKGMYKAEPGAFLFEKISVKIEKSKNERTTENNHVIKWAFGIITLSLIIANIISINSYFSKKTNEISTTQNSGISYNYSTIYSY